MAFTAREVILTFRGQNYLSGALRRVGRDVGSLSRGTNLSNQRAAMQIAMQRTRNSIRLAEAEKASIATGTRRQAIDIARSGLNDRELNHLQQVRRLGEAITLNQKQQLDAEIKASQLARAKPGRRVPGYGTLTKDELAKARQAQTLAQDRLLEQQITLERQQEVLSQKTATHSARVQQLAAREAELIERNGQLIAQSQALAGQLDRQAIAEQRLARIESEVLPVQQWQDRARAVEHFGRVLQMVGLIATAALGASAHAAANLSTQVTLAATQARPVGASPGVTANIARNVQRQTLQLMRTLPFQGQDFADAFYQIFSGTNIQNVGQATKLIQTFGRAAVAGGTDLKTMVDVGITMHNVFPKEFKNSTDAANAFFAAVRYGRMNAQQFAQSLPNIVPIAQRVGLSFQDIANAIAALTRQSGGRFTTRDAQGIARMIQTFSRPDFVAGAKKMGVNIKDAAGNMRPLLDIITDFSNKTKGTGGVDALNLFKTISAIGSSSGTGGTQGTIQAQRAFAFLINDIKNYRDVSKLVRSDNNEMVRSFEAMSKAPGVRWTLFINQLKVLAYTIGNAVIPVFIRLAQPIETFAKWFMQLSPQAQKTIATFVAIASVGSLLLGTFLGIAGGLGSMVTQLMIFRRMRSIESMAELALGASRSSGALSGLASEAGSVSTKMATRLGLVGVIASLIIFHKQVGDVVNALGGLGNVITIVTGAIAAFSLVRTITGIATLVSEAQAAERAVSLLRLGVLGLAGLTATVTIYEIIKHRDDTSGSFISNPLGFTKNFRDKVDSALNKAQNAVTKYSGAHAIGSILGYPGGFGHYAETRTPAEIQAEQAHNAISQAISDSPRYQHAIRANQQAVNAFNKKLNEQARLVHNVRVRQATTEIQRQPNLMASIRSLQQLKVVAEQSPNIQVSNRNWNRYYAELNKLLQSKTQVQKDAIRKLLTQSFLPPAVQGRSINDWIGLVEKARQAAELHPNQVKAQLAYEKIQDQLNKRYKDQPSLLAAINDVLSNYNQNLQQVTNNTKTLGITSQDVLQGIQSMYQNFQQQETGLFGDIFQGPFSQNPLTQNRLQFGGRLSGQDLLRDLHSQIFRFRHFHGQLDSLRRRGAPQELLNQLMAAGDTTDNMRNIAQLQSLNPHQLNEYFRTFNQGQRMIRQATTRDLQNQLKIYRQHGRNIALAIIAGLRDENVNLTNTLSRMIRKMFPGLPTGAVGAGGRPTHKAPTPPVPTVNVHVHPDHDKENKPPITKKAAQRHADLRQKNRYAIPRGGVPR